MEKCYQRGVVRLSASYRSEDVGLGANSIRTEGRIMSAAPSLVVQRQESRSDAESFCDSSLLGLAPEVRLRLYRWKASHWMSSLRFAESYCFPPAQRVSYITGPDGEILEACFYRESKWGVVFKSISLTCLVQPESKVFQMLICHRLADLIQAS